MVTKPYVTSVSYSFTRPSDTTAYADEDLVANSTTAGSVVPMSFPVGVANGRGVKVVGVTIQKSDGTDAANATFSVRLFASSPTVANGDNGAISHDVAGYFTEIACPIMVAHTDDCKTHVYAGAVSGGYNAPYVYLRSSNTIYGLLKAEAAYSPASAEVFTVTLLIEQY